MKIFKVYQEIPTIENICESSKCVPLARKYSGVVYFLDSKGHYADANEAS